MLCMCIRMTEIPCFHFLFSLPSADISFGQDLYMMGWLTQNFSKSHFLPDETVELTLLHAPPCVTEQQKSKCPTHSEAKQC